jgi:hypothetical protein
MYAEDLKEFTRTISTDTQKAIKHTKEEASKAQLTTKVRTQFQDFIGVHLSTSSLRNIRRLVLDSFS